MGGHFSITHTTAALDLFRAWSREGGKKGAKARWAGVSAGERRAHARKAAAARWAKKAKSAANR
jgi:hypothetical protein